MKANEKENIALESASERQINPAGQLLFKQGNASGWHNADYFDRLLLLLAFIQIGAPSNMAAAVALG